MDGEPGRGSRIHGRPEARGALGGYWHAPGRGRPVVGGGGLSGAPRARGLGGGAAGDPGVFAGTLTLKAAGLETVETNEARNTWLEILGQSLSAMARSIGGVLGREVACEAGAERAPEANPEAAASVSLTFGDTPQDPLWIGFSPKLVALLSHPAGGDAGEAPTVDAGDDAVHARRGGVPPTMELLLDVELPVSVSFGKTEIPMKGVLKLTTGSIVELNRGVNEPVEVLVNHCLIARGEVVVVEGNYGVRIQQIVSRHDRLRSVK